jgi:hypothetical protein
MSTWLATIIIDTWLTTVVCKIQWIENANDCFLVWRILIGSQELHHVSRFMYTLIHVAEPWTWSSVSSATKLTIIATWWYVEYNCLQNMSCNLMKIFLLNNGSKMCMKSRHIDLLYFQLRHQHLICDSLAKLHQCLYWEAYFLEQNCKLSTIVLHEHSSILNPIHINTTTCHTNKQAPTKTKINIIFL